MPSSKDYWNLPEGHRAELINGQFYDMAPPSRIHQKLVSELTQTIGSHIKSKGGRCEVYPAPFAVNLDAEDKNWVEPDVSVICDKNKRTDSGCSGAPDPVSYTHLDVYKRQPPTHPATPTDRMRI